MARPSRELVAGGIYHVFARGNDRGLIYRDDRDRLQYLRLLAAVIRRTGWRLLAYCLMGNHVHLLVETPRPNLAEGMQWLHGHYARYFNDRHDRVGHMFQGRYKAVRQRADVQLLATIRYIVHNPVAGGLCSSPDEYPWSSHGAMSARSDPLVDVDRVLWLLDVGDGAAGRRQYAQLVAAEPVELAARAA